jgi:hypothetical protein
LNVILKSQISNSERAFRNGFHSKLIARHWKSQIQIHGYAPIIRIIFPLQKHHISAQIIHRLFLNPSTTLKMFSPFYAALSIRANEWLAMRTLSVWTDLNFAAVVQSPNEHTPVEGLAALSIRANEWLAMRTLSVLSDLNFAPVVQAPNEHTPVEGLAALSIRANEWLAMRTLSVWTEFRFVLRA